MRTFSWRLAALLGALAAVVIGLTIAPANGATPPQSARTDAGPTRVLGYFADSCYNLVKDPRWADVFDGIDIDWEYPNACGLSCDTSGFSSINTLLSALRNRFGSGALVPAAISGDGTDGGKLDAADYAGAA